MHGDNKQVDNLIRIALASLGVFAETWMDDFPHLVSYVSLSDADLQKIRDQLGSNSHGDHWHSTTRTQGELAELLLKQVEIARATK